MSSCTIKPTMTSLKISANLLVLTLLLISSCAPNLRVACDATVGAQVQLQQQQIQPQQVGVKDVSAQVNNGVAAGAAVMEQKPQAQLINYLSPFEPGVTSIPAAQREFVVRTIANDLELFREILREAIERRNKFAPAVGLIWKYATKLLGRLISNRREEVKIPGHLEAKPEFYGMLADMTSAVLDRSTDAKKEKGYSKKNIDTGELYRRVDNIFKYIQSMVEACPYAGYQKWNELIVFKSDPTNPDHDRPIVDYAADLAAQFRAMGYENCVFVARRIVNLLRMFSRGFIPESDKEV